MTDAGKKDTGCCSGNEDTGCCGCTQDNGDNGEIGRVGIGRITIDFLYLDLSVCTRCQGTDSSLGEALENVAQVLDATGAEVILNKVNITSEELAARYRFVSSPTIRVNGRDIQMDVKESLCESCGDLCGEDVDCRVWVYQGKEYAVPPKAMIIQAILKEVYGENNDGAESAGDPHYVIPQNLKKYFAALRDNIAAIRDNIAAVRDSI